MLYGYQSSSYAWDEPSLPSRLVVDVLASPHSKLSEMINRVGISTHSELETTFHTLGTFALSNCPVGKVQVSSVAKSLRLTAIMCPQGPTRVLLICPEQLISSTPGPSNVVRRLNSFLPRSLFGWFRPRAKLSQKKDTLSELGGGVEGVRSDRTYFYGGDDIKSAGFQLKVTIPAIGLSVVDATPRELLYFSLQVGSFLLLFVTVIVFRGWILMFGKFHSQPAYLAPCLVCKSTINCTVLLPQLFCALTPLHPDPRFNGRQSLRQSGRCKISITL
jgi:hypothetical protein